MLCLINVTFIYFTVWKKGMFLSTFPYLIVRKKNPLLVICNHFQAINPYKSISIKRKQWVYFYIKCKSCVLKSFQRIWQPQNLWSPLNKIAVYLGRRVRSVLQTRHTGAQQGCRAWMLNLRPVGCFIQRYKQVQALLHAPSRGVSMGWIVKQYMEPPC